MKKSTLEKVTVPTNNGNSKVFYVDQHLSSDDVINSVRNRYPEWKEFSYKGNSYDRFDFDNGGLFVGKLHSQCSIEEGCGEKFVVEGNGKNVEVEREEFLLPTEAMDSKKVYDLTGTPLEILKQLTGDFCKHCEIAQRITAGSAIVRRTAVYDKNLYHVKGTPRQIASALNEMHQGRKFGEGAFIEKVNNTKDTSKKFKKCGEVKCEKKEINYEEIEQRWHKKKERIETLSSSIRSLKNNVTRDLKSDDEKGKLTALVIAVMMNTSERVGNQDSEKDGHFGVTGFTKRHIEIDGNTVYLKYRGKSGVDQEKQFSDELISDTLKKAIKNSPSKFVFTTSDGFRIKADRVNRYLSEYGISAKDLRGHSANKIILKRLEKEEIADTENNRKSDFNKAVKFAASKVGHGPATLKKHYMIPELSREYIMNGKLIDLSTFYSEGGKVDSKEAPKEVTQLPEFKKWFEGSKIVNSVGEPLVVYHGTNEEFNRFSLSKASDQTGSDWGYLGFFFTDDEKLARQFTKNNWMDNREKLPKSSKVIKAYLSIKNPRIISGRDFALFGAHPKDIRKHDIRDGYDGWIIKKFSDKDIEWAKKNIYGSSLIKEFSANQYVAFYPEQIKLSDGKNTTFDSKSPDIRFSKGGELSDKLIAPNGKESNLTPIQYNIVRTPEFKNWFGDWENSPETASKIIDENGEPLVLYHGTNSGFNIFNQSKSIGTHGEKDQIKGIYFTSNKEVANWFTVYSDNPKYLKSVFLSVKNPFFGENINSIKKELNVKNTSEITDKLINYDGLIIEKGFYTLGLNTLYLVFNPEQVKLADGTNTTFDSGNKDIRYRLGGKINDKFDLGKDHHPFIRVAPGGSACGNCLFLNKNGKKYTCGNKLFVEWNGTPNLPNNIWSICSDWWEPNPKFVK